MVVYHSNEDIEPSIKVSKSWEFAPEWIVCYFYCNVYHLKISSLYVVVVVTLFPTKSMKTHICTTHLLLSIPKMCACIVSVAARKSQGLSSWLPQHVTYNFCARLPGPAWYMTQSHVKLFKTNYDIYSIFRGQYIYMYIYLCVCV